MFFYIYTKKRLPNLLIRQPHLADLTATFEYSKDRIKWDTYSWGTYGTSVTKTALGDPIALAEGDTVFFRAKGTNGLNATMSNAISYFNFAFGADDSIAAGGNIMSLYDASCTKDTMKVFGFCSLFAQGKQLVSAPKLPAKKLADGCYTYMFNGCSSLTQAPALPATTLATNCYQYMFFGCKSLTSAPELKATTLTSFCYNSMFQNCTALTQAPELKADTLADRCYQSMFKGCTSLTQAPELKATALAKSCCQGMFYECTSLTQAPELKADTLAEKCYNSMFQGCTSLTQAPELKATALAKGCYQAMFYECTALTQAPELKADILTNSCYTSMFQGCTSLTQAPELKATTLAEKCYSWMFYGCTALEVNASSTSCDGAELVVPDTTAAPTNWNMDMFTGCKGDTALTKTNGIQPNSHYCIREYVEPDMHDFLYFVSLKENGTVRLNKFGSPKNLLNLTATFQYSKDRINWSDYTWDATDSKTGAAIELKNAGDTVFFRAKGTNGKNTAISYNMTTYYCFSFGANDSIAAGGNIMSLYDASCEQVTMTAYGFAYLFNRCSTLVAAPKLPATQLATYCYFNLFRNSSLTQAPELPATKMAPWCYASMFSACKSLTQAPELISTDLAYCCYNSMCINCSTLVAAPALPATEMTSKCYYQMFQNCVALTDAPELKPTVLADSCYGKMFSGCSKLEVNTCLDDATCNGALLVVPAMGKKDWNMDMFTGCKGDAALTAQYGIQLGGHYCIREYVELAPYTRNVTSGNYGTICLEREAVSLKGAAFYEVLGKIADSQVVLAEVDTLEAGKPYVFKADSSAIECAYNTAKEAVTDTIPGNGIIGSFAGCDVPTGMYIISLTDSKLHKTGTDCKIDANRAYFNLSTMTNAPQAPARKLHYIGIYQDAATGVQDVENAMPIQKMMINGQLMILRDGKMYDVMGARSQE